MPCRRRPATRLPALRPLVVLLVALVVPSATAQNTNPVLTVLPFEVTGITAEQSRLIEQAVAHSILETGEFRMIDRSRRDELLAELELAASDLSPSDVLRAGRLLAAQGAVTGTVGAFGDTIVISLRLVKIETGETLRSVSESFAGVEEFVDGLPDVARRLIGLEEEAAELPEPVAAPALMRPVVGVWSGDRGIDRVFLEPDGTGRVVFLNGAEMALHVSFGDGLYLFRQSVPNEPAFFESLVPVGIAVQLSEVARPVRWTMRLSEDGNELLGRKETTSFRRSGGRVMAYNNDYSRRAVWRRIPEPQR